ncbi:MAG: hypothetical protein AABX48_00325 [Nanoarchaeota archaeon]
MKEWKFNLTYKNAIILLSILLVIVTILTSFYGYTDIGDYSDVAKYFSGDYNAGIRSSHSYFYGFIMSPLVGLLNNYFAFKIVNLIFIFLILLSMYFISGKDKRIILLSLVAPAVWYISPWITPIIISSFFLLWAWFFIKKYDTNNDMYCLSFAGISLGLSYIFWDTIIFFGLFMAFVFMYNKKFSHFTLLSLAIFVGIMPRLLLDQYLFNFALFSIMKSFLGTLANAFLFGRGTSYAGGLFNKIILLLLILVSIPLYYWKNYSIENLKQNKKTIIFLTLCLLLIFINPQVRYVFSIFPILLLTGIKYIDQKRMKKQIIFSLVISLIFIFPYVVQFYYHPNTLDGRDITYILQNPENPNLSSISRESIISSDLDKIAVDFKNESFIVGNLDDDYRKLAHIYWGSGINEFISIQDYQLFLENNSKILSKKFEPIPNINERRLIWFAGGIDGNNLHENLNNVNYAITFGDDFRYSNFELYKKYEGLYVWRKING